jgi:hypothetical protein
LGAGYHLGITLSELRTDLPVNPLVVACGGAEFSEIADMMGMPWDTWVVREFLPTSPIGVCPRYGDMPVCREFRYFINDGRYVCSHPYWPKDSIVEGGFDISNKDFSEVRSSCVPITPQPNTAGKAPAWTGAAAADFYLA